MYRQTDDNGYLQLSIALVCQEHDAPGRNSEGTSRLGCLNNDPDESEAARLHHHADQCYDNIKPAAADKRSAPVLVR